MNQNGSGDKQTCIKDGELFLSYNTHGLFYTSYDSTYKMTKAERESDYDLSSRNLMVYNPVTNASTMIQKHIYDAVALGSKIYMIDHLKHFHILCYDMSKGTLTDVKGFPSEYRHATVINLSLDDDGVEVQCSNSATDEDGNEGTDGWDVYLIDGNRIITDGGYPEDTESPQDSDETDTPTDGYTYDVDYSTYYDLDNGAKFRLDGNNMLAILTGTYYEDLDIPSVYDATIVGSKLYVLSSSYAEAILDVDDDAGYPYAVYSVSPSGSIQKLDEGTDMTPENPLNNMVCEAVGNWYFVYWTNDSCSYFSSLLIKLKTE